jgi:hypothetical protein
MSQSLMLGMIREHGSRAQYRDACTYAARGNVAAIAGIYRRIVGA